MTVGKGVEAAGSARHADAAAGHGLRPEIQAIRGLAVCLVVLYHVFPFRLQGGYVGVDVFFVISGFLITDHISRAIEQDRFTFAGFYMRRARRLLPAASTVLVVVAVVIFYVAPMPLWETVGKQTLASAFYVQNWILAADSVDYLAQNSDASPVQHFWSLAVEEQFYLVWPLLLMLARAMRGRGAPRNRIAVAIAVVCGLSFVVCVVGTLAGPAAYFETPVRAWEFGAGGLLAVSSGWRRMLRWPRIAAWVGLLLIIFSAFAFNSATSFPGWVALLPIFGSILVIAAGDPSGRWSPSLLYRLRPVRFLGDVSYALYLWHWPLIVLVPMFVGGFGYQLTNVPERFAVIAGSILLAWLTKIYIEDRFRVGPGTMGTGHRTAWSWVRRDRGITAALVGMAVAGVLGGCLFAASAAKVQQARTDLDTFLASGVPCEATAGGSPASPACWRPAPGALYPDPVIAAQDSPHQNCQQTAERSELIECRYGASRSSELMVLVGDSHANQWTSALAAVAQQRGWTLLTYVKSGCPFTAGPRWSPSCVRWNQLLSERLTALDVRLVVTSGQGVPSGSPRELDQAVQGLTAAWAPLAARNVPVVAIADTPWPRAAGLQDPPSCVAAKASAPAACSFSLDAGLVVDPQIVASARTPRSVVVDLNRHLCPSAGVCPSSVGNLLVYRDGEHLTDVMARSLHVALDAALHAVVGNG